MRALCHVWCVSNAQLATGPSSPCAFQASYRSDGLTDRDHSMLYHGYSLAEAVIRKLGLESSAGEVCQS